MLIINSVTLVSHQKKIFDNLSVSIEPHKIHALLGPNGSGKTSFAYMLAGHPDYEIMSGNILWQGEDITAFRPEERAKKGMYLAFQQPIAIPGLKVFNLLSASYKTMIDKEIDLTIFQKMVEQLCDKVGLPHSFLYRNVHEGFSGGERKKLEIVQLLLLKPKFIMLDEIDSGLDIDAIRLIGKALAELKNECKEITILIITHHQRIFDFLKPTQVHIMKDGRLTSWSNDAILKQIMLKGYNELG